MTATKAKIGGHYYEAVGRRKTSVARVRLMADKKGAFFVNTKEANNYFKNPELQMIINKPFATANVAGKELSVSAKVVGGGIHSQAEALSHGISRALLKVDAAYRVTLKKDNLLTRDSRMKERRKFGLKKARKSPQWSKR